jgi:hypothetical protein
MQPLNIYEICIIKTEINKCTINESASYSERPRLIYMKCTVSLNLRSNVTILDQNSLQLSHLYPLYVAFFMLYYTLTSYIIVQQFSMCFNVPFH